MARENQKVQNNRGKLDHYGLILPVIRPLQGQRIHAGARRCYTLRPLRPVTPAHSRRRHWTLENDPRILKFAIVLVK